MFDHTFEARSEDEAKEIATRHGWELLGELVAEQIIYADELEEIVESMKAERLH